MSFSEANRSDNIFIDLGKGSLQIFQITEKLEIFLKMWIINAAVDTICGWHLDIKRCLGLVPFPEQKRVEEIVDHEDLDVCVDSKEFYVSHNAENAFESEEVFGEDRNGTEVVSDRPLLGKGLKNRTKNQNQMLIDTNETDSDHTGKQIGSEIILTETQESNLNTVISRECEENIVDHGESERDTGCSSSENLQEELEEDKRKASDKENIIQDEEFANHTEVVAFANCSKLKEEGKDSNSITDTAEHLAVHKDNKHTYKKDNEEIDEENKQETKKDPLVLDTSLNEIINKRPRDRKDSKISLQQSEIYEQPKSLSEIVGNRIRDFEIHGVRSWKYLYQQVSP